MLISPLMGLIVGAGFGLGVYDFDLLKDPKTYSYSCWLIGFYHIFYVSPFKEAQPELLSRTSPNIYDIPYCLFLVWLVRLP
jgi:uncharacterized membrane protein